MRVTFAPFAFSVLALLAQTCVAQAVEQRSTLADQQEVAVTIYNDNLALVKDQRRVQLGRGPVALAFRDVSATMRPETALLRSVSAPGAFSVREQNFDFDVLTPQKLLEKYVGRSVTVVRTNPATGADTAEQAIVLSADHGVVLQIGARIETGLPGRLVFNAVPANLRDRPTLVIGLDNQGVAQQDVELSYLTAGLGWKADYVMELHANEDQLDMSGWVTLTNTSGTSYRNAKLQLVAGDVHQVEPELQRMRPGLAMAAIAPRPERLMAEENLLEYHLYTLGHPTTLADNQTKQVALLSASGVPARKSLVLQGSGNDYQTVWGAQAQPQKVGVYLTFDNKDSAHLGMPLPKGVVRVYKKDSAGNAQFVGEDRIEHTPKNAAVRLRLGDAFDVTADKIQTDFKKLPVTGKYNDGAESAYQLVLKNAKKEAVTVSVQEPMPGDWQIVSSSQPYTKAAASTAVWTISVPAEGSAVLTYRVAVRY